MGASGHAGERLNAHIYTAASPLFMASVVSRSVLKTCCSWIWIRFVVLASVLMKAAGVVGVMLSLLHGNTGGV